MAREHTETRPITPSLEGAGYLWRKDWDNAGLDLGAEIQRHYRAWENAEPIWDHELLPEDLVDVSEELHNERLGKKLASTVGIPHPERERRAKEWYEEVGKREAKRREKEEQRRFDRLKRRGKKERRKKAIAEAKVMAKEYDRLYRFRTRINDQIIDYGRPSRWGLRIKSGDYVDWIRNMAPIIRRGRQKINAVYKDAHLNMTVLEFTEVPTEDEMLDWIMMLDPSFTEVKAFLTFYDLHGQLDDVSLYVVS